MAIARPCHATRPLTCSAPQVRGDLVRALEGLLKRRADFDLILVETTGLADPAPIVKTFTESDKVILVPS